MKNLALLIIVVVVVASTAYIGLTYYDQQFKYGRMWETPAIRPHEKPIPIMSPETVPFSGGDAIFAATPEEELRSPLVVTHDTITRGKNGYFLYCAQCHGIKHDGNGTVGQSFAPLPSDLRSAKVQARSEGSLFKEISFGKPGGRQPALASTIDTQDRWRIVAYVQSLGPRQ